MLYCLLLIIFPGFLFNSDYRLKPNTTLNINNDIYPHSEAGAGVKETMWKLTLAMIFKAIITVFTFGMKVTFLFCLYLFLTDLLHCRSTLTDKISLILSIRTLVAMKTFLKFKDAASNQAPPIKPRSDTAVFSSTPALQTYGTV